jgi:Calcineurin-like phosphoesterase
VLVAGNHDQSIEALGLPSGLRCHYLEDDGIELFGLELWGTPWQPWFNDWAFNARLRNSNLFLASRSSLIPADTDVVVCHGPPPGYGDHYGEPGEDAHVGSTAMTETLERLQPRLVVCGHIHSGYGRYELGDSEIIKRLARRQRVQTGVPGGSDLALGTTEASGIALGLYAKETSRRRTRARPLVGEARELARRLTPQNV